MDDRSGSIWAVAIIFLVSSWVAVCLRIYVRIEQIGKFGLDDQLVLLAQIFFTAYLACQIGGVVHGTGRHLADLDYNNAEIALKFWFFCELWYALACSTVKVAICCSLKRVTVRFAHLVVIHGIIIWSIALGLAFFLGIIFQCIPASDWWSLDPNMKRCLSAHIITSLTYTVSALNVACDWTLGIFPFFIVKDLSIPMYQKILVASILAFGAIASTATIVRMAYIPTLEQTYLGSNGDFLYDTTPVAIWTTVEVGVAITAICLSTLRPLISKVLWFVRPSVYGTTYGDGYVSDDSQRPIPLTDSQTLPEREFGAARSMPRDDLAGITQFNRTKPIGGAAEEVDLGSRRSRPILHDTTGNPSRFNATKALSSSDTELEEDLYTHSPTRRYGTSRRGRQR